MKFKNSVFIGVFVLSLFFSGRARADEVEVSVTNDLEVAVENLKTLEQALYYQGTTNNLSRSVAYYLYQLNYKLSNQSSFMEYWPRYFFGFNGQFNNPLLYNLQPTDFVSSSFRMTNVFDRVKLTNTSLFTPYLGGFSAFANIDFNYRFRDFTNQFYYAHQETADYLNDILTALNNLSLEPGTSGHQFISSGFQSVDQNVSSVGSSVASVADSVSAVGSSVASVGSSVASVADSVASVGSSVASVADSVASVGSSVASVADSVAAVSDGVNAVDTKVNALSETLSTQNDSLSGIADSLTAQGHVGGAVDTIANSTTDIKTTLDKIFSSLSVDSPETVYHALRELFDISRYFLQLLGDANSPGVLENLYTRFLSDGSVTAGVALSAIKDAAESVDSKLDGILRGSDLESAKTSLLSIVDDVAILKTKLQDISSSVSNAGGTTDEIKVVLDRIAQDGIPVNVNMPADDIEVIIGGSSGSLPVNLPDSVETDITQLRELAKHISDSIDIFLDEDNWPNFLSRFIEVEESVKTIALVISNINSRHTFDYSHDWSRDIQDLPPVIPNSKSDNWFNDVFDLLNLTANGTRLIFRSIESGNYDASSFRSSYFKYYFRDGQYAPPSPDVVIDRGEVVWDSNYSPVENLLNAQHAVIERLSALCNSQVVIVTNLQVIAKSLQGEDVNEEEIVTSVNDILDSKDSLVSSLSNPLSEMSSSEVESLIPTVTPPNFGRSFSLPSEISFSFSSWSFSNRRSRSSGNTVTIDVGSHSTFWAIVRRAVICCFCVVALLFALGVFVAMCQLAIKVFGWLIKLFDI